jgi:hypothetical protein
MALKISEEAKVQMPMKTVVSLITIVAIGTWAFFSFQEKLNQHATTITNYGKRFGRKYGVPNQVAEGVT